MAAEYFDEATRRWNYIDPYLDLLLPGVSAAQVRRSAFAGHLLGAFTKLRTLERQFMYRRYFDRLNRMTPITMVQMGDAAGESTWGTQWTLVRPRSWRPEDLFADRCTIHVRARYVLTSGQRVLHRAVRPEPAPSAGIVASEWAQTSFEIRPRELLGIG